MNILTIYELQYAVIRFFFFLQYTIHLYVKLFVMYEFFLQALIFVVSMELNYHFCLFSVCLFIRAFQQWRLGMYFFIASTLFICPTNILFILFSGKAEQKKFIFVQRLDSGELLSVSNCQKPTSCSQFFDFFLLIMLAVTNIFISDLASTFEHIFDMQLNQL